MADDKRDRKVRLFGQFDQNRFQQEVAEEIGLSLGRKGNRRNVRARSQVAGPGASGFTPGQPGSPGATGGEGGGPEGQR